MLAQRTTSAVNSLNKNILKGNQSSAKKERGSQFWRGLNKIKHGFSWGAVFEVKDGKSTRFWEDVWRGDIPLKIAYPKLYELCNDKTRLVSDFYDDGEWYISFRRSLGGQTLNCGRTS